MENGFKKGLIDKALIIKTQGSDMLIGQIYVDDFLFGGTNVSRSKEFCDLMSKEFEKSIMGELTFFLGFQIKREV